MRRRLGQTVASEPVTSFYKKIAMKRYLQQLTVYFGTGKKARSRPRSFRPSLEALEDRAVPAVLFQPVVAAPLVAPATTAPAAAAFKNILATPTVNVSAAGGVFNGNPFAATATVAGTDGVQDSTLEGVSLTLDYQQNNLDGTVTDLGAAAPSAVGNYVVMASFAGSANYAPASAFAAFSIIPATPTINQSAVGGVFNGNPVAAIATVAGADGVPASALEGVGLTFDYQQNNADGTVTELGAAAPAAVGNYSVTVSFAGSANYAPASASASFSITNPLGQQLVDWLHARIGTQIGDGECATTVNAALKAFGLPSYDTLGPTGPDADYVWGTLLLTYHAGDAVSLLDQIRPGDIIQFRNVTIHDVVPGGYYDYSFPHHTAMVEANQGGGNLTLLESNLNGNLNVAETLRHFAVMTGGTIWVYRPIGA
jgi:hypothetical protein